MRRSWRGRFAGDAKQVRELLKAAFSHKGTAVLDIISPCVTFNNHEDSTKSYPYGKAHEEPLQDITFIPEYEPIAIDPMEPGEVQTVDMHDGSHVVLKKLDPKKHDPTDRTAAFRLLEEARRENQFITGLIYVDQDRQDAGRDQPSGGRAAGASARRAAAPAA